MAMIRFGKQRPPAEEEESLIDVTDNTDTGGMVFLAVLSWAVRALKCVITQCNTT